MTAERRTRALLFTIIAVGGSLPLLLYWLFLGRVPTITADEAKTLLASSGQATLLDVRPAEEFQSDHIEAAQNWPYADIAALVSSAAMPQQFRGKKLLLICNGGVTSGLATRKLRELHVPDVANVEGGMQAWVAAAEKPCTLSLCRLRDATGDATALPFRESPRYEQWAAVLTGFGVKPLYMTLALLLVFILRRQQSPDLLALRWGLLFFFAGEAFCALNYLFTTHESYLLEYLHCFGMVLTFGFTTYALLEGIDLRLLKYSHPKDKCAALGLCRVCIKYTDAACGLRRMFLLIIPAAMTLAVLPLCVAPNPTSYNTRILGAFYNYSHPVVHQIYETRYLPFAALVLFAASLLVLVWRERHPVSVSKVLFAAGAGALGFAWFRLFLFAPFADNQVWFAFWEEVTELLYVASIGFVLLVFRGALLGPRTVPEERASRGPE
jgi:rhodanese-related sulfurtransferase